VNIGAPPSAESYLKATASSRSLSGLGAEAVHPGYGFLSEREWFARAVRDAGLGVIGPPAEAIAAIGSKTSARQLVIAADVPVVPGTTDALRDADEARAIAEKFGYPVLLKAAAAAAERECDSSARRASWRRHSKRRAVKQRMRSATTPCTSRSTSKGPRHVEIQVLGDHHGTMLSLNERECSVQRRHQKMIEEAPSVAVTP
jgi:acetyl-CoA carboxylase biotin carboxylase subunit